MLFFREDIPSKLVEAEAKDSYIELSLRNGKWMLNCSSNLHKDNIGNHLKGLKIVSAIKHRKTAEEIIVYAQRVYSLLLKLEKNKV